MPSPRIVPPHITKETLMPPANALATPDPILLPVTYAIYLVISLSVTIWVARTLHKSGRPFLIDAMHGNETLADSINRLLVVGFYLVNVGFVSLFLRLDRAPASLPAAIESLSFKLGVVLVVLGIMHFTNLLIFGKWREHALRPSRPAWSHPASPYAPPAPHV